MWVRLQSSHHKASRVYQHDAQKPPSIPSDKKRNPIKVLSTSTDEHSDGTKTLLLYLRLLSSIIKYELYVHDSKHEVYDSALQNKIQITLCLYLVIHRSSTNEALVLLALWFWGQTQKDLFVLHEALNHPQISSACTVTVGREVWTPVQHRKLQTLTKKQMGSLGHWTGQNITINIHDNPKRKGDLFHFKLLLLKLRLSYYTASTLSSVHIVSDVLSSI